MNSPQDRRLLESLDRRSLTLLQWTKLQALLTQILPRNRFYAEKLGEQAVSCSSLEQFQQLPLTTKDELATDSPEGFAANRTLPIEAYTRFHRTSGTRGRPLVVLDTPEDWQWWLDTWQFTLDAAEIDRSDHVLMAFSFGPFIGFWTAHEAILRRGSLVIPGGGLSTQARLELIRTQRVTALFCTPSYALHLAEVAREQRWDVGQLGVRRIIVAGEPGGSQPALRGLLEQTWQAKVIDHAGATEVGPWGYGDDHQRGLRVVESEFFVEFLSCETGKPASDGELSELIITSLGRAGCPVLRYRTGDLVRPHWPTDEANRFVLLTGGVLGRVDDMLIVRGVNIFPGAVEAILREFPDVVEFRLTATKAGQLDELRIEVEDRQEDPTRIQDLLQLRLGLRVAVECVPLGTLPRFEGKGRRFVDLRRTT